MSATLKQTQEEHPELVERFKPTTDALAIMFPACKKALDHVGKLYELTEIRTVASHCLLALNEVDTMDTENEKLSELISALKSQSENDNDEGIINELIEEVEIAVEFVQKIADFVWRRAKEINNLSKALKQKASETSSGLAVKDLVDGSSMAMTTERVTETQTIDTAIERRLTPTMNTPPTKITAPQHSAAAVTRQSGSMLDAATSPQKKAAAATSSIKPGSKVATRVKPRSTKAVAKPKPKPKGTPILSSLVSLLARCLCK